MPEARALAARLLNAVSREDRDALAARPFAALEALGFGLRFRREREITGSCSVAASIDCGPPPVITIVMAASTGRQYFSALHEFGHWIVKTDADVHDVFFGLHDGGAHLEEDICDAIAGELLMPPEHVSEYIGSCGPTAQSVIALIRSTPNASREACCVRAAERISGPGHVMLLRAGVALFTASHITPYRVRRGAAQADGHVTSRAARFGVARGEASVKYAGGSRSDTFFVDAALDEEESLVVAVFMENKPPWAKGLVLPPPDRNADAEMDAYCIPCEVDFAAIGGRCPTCEGNFHRGLGGCGRCACRPDNASCLCEECYLRRPLADFSQDPKICDVCLDS